MFALAPIDPAQIMFRYLQAPDLVLMHRWLNEGESGRWYGLAPTTVEEIAKEYTPRLGGGTNVLSMIVSYAGTPIGYVQRYFPAEHPDYWGHLEGLEDAAGIDLFIGETAFLHRGLGPIVISQFLREHVFSDGRIARCIIDPDPANLAAVRAYEKVGFRFVRMLAPPEHCETAALMEVPRHAFEAS